jgi:dTDP-4-dehydrorhamnose reductase
LSGHNLPLDGSLRLNAAGDRFVEAVGDYVLSRLQQKSHYDVSDDLPDVPPCAERGADVGPEVITTTDRDHALHVQNRDPVSWCRQCVGPFFDV